MKVSPDWVTATPCDASCMVPSQPIIIAEAAKRLTSLRLVRPIGMPSLKTRANISQSGR